MMSVSASWGMPGFGGPESMAFTDFECLPPITTTDFAKHLRAGNLEQAIPWQTLARMRIDPSTRLIFEQRVGFEFVSGSFILVESDKDMEKRKADALTGTKYTQNLSQKAPGRPTPPFMQNLLALSEEHHLYRIQERDFADLDSTVYSSLVQPGTLAFTHQTGAFILSPDRSQISVCMKVDQYEDKNERHDWLVLEPDKFDAASISKIAFHFTQDPRVTSVLRCDELLVGR
jgi:hypothetical protein